MDSEIPVGFGGFAPTQKTDWPAAADGSTMLLLRRNAAAIVLSGI